MPSFGPLDDASGAVQHLLMTLAAALAPIDGGAAAALAVVLLTALVRLMLVPLSRRQVAIQRAQAALAPQVAELRERYGSDPQRLGTELAALYRRSGTGSPLSAFVPGLLQMPVITVLYTVFNRSTVDGRANLLLNERILGVPLGAHGLAAGVPLLLLLAGIAVVATVTARRMRRGGQPTWLAATPYLSLVPAAVFLPLAAGLYLLTTMAWSAAENRVLRRDERPAPPKPATTR